MRNAQRFCAGPARPIPGARRATRPNWTSNVCSLTLAAMQLRLDAADRLVELVEERRGPVYVEEAARRLFALRHAPVGLARSLLEEVVSEDSRLAWRGGAVGVARRPRPGLLLVLATSVVVVLETTALRPGTGRIREI